MLETLVSMLITFFPLWMGRDKVWTPTFEGTREERFVKAMHHYQDKMGIEESFIFTTREYSPKHPICSSVQLSGEWDAVIISFYVKPNGKQPNGCSGAKPEFWALHEACHLRYQHHRMNLDPKKKEEEAKDCMLLYSAKERR